MTVAMERTRTLRLGYRQHALLAIMRESGRILPVGYLMRAAGIEQNNVVYVALRGLEARGLVRRAEPGKWVAT